MCKGWFINLRKILVNVCVLSLSFQKFIMVASSVVTIIVVRVWKQIIIHLYLLSKASAGRCCCWLGHLGQASQLSEYLQLLSSSQLTSPNHGFHGEFNVMQTFSSDWTPQSRGDIDNNDAAHWSKKMFKWWEESRDNLFALDDAGRSALQTAK